MVHRTLADHLGDHKIGNQFDLSLLQRRGRIGHAGRVSFQIGLCLAVTAAVAVGKLIEGRHLRIQPATLDRQHQAVAVHLRFAQVGSIRHLIVGFMAIARPAVTRLAVGFLLIQPHALGDVGGIGRCRLRGGLCRPQTGETLAENGNRTDRQRDQRQISSNLLHTAEYTPLQRSPELLYSGRKDDMKTSITLAAVALVVLVHKDVTVHTQTAGSATPKAVASRASDAGPRFQIDPFWPKPLPEGWIIGRTGSICPDTAHDLLVVTNRRDITAEEAETSKQSPSILIFDTAGKLVDSWGDSDTVPGTIHGCFVDHENNIWLTGNGDGIIQKWSHDGKMLMQIGKRGVFDTSDGTAKGERLNAGRSQFFNPAGVVVDPGNGDVYVADGYGNRRVAVFDRQGNFLRQWGRQATKEETESGAPGVFAQLVHCIAMSRAGLIYVCDRQGDRVQVFDKTGKFIRNIWIRTGTPTLPDPRGTAWWIAFSRDPEQKYMYVMNGRNEQLHILDHASGKILSSFGRPGHWLGNFTHGHAVAVDASGNLYIAETDTGRRMQKFKPVASTSR